ncbi:MAG: DNA translocase FtsK, partial [Deltaproteobacteria bacterium]
TLQSSLSVYLGVLLLAAAVFLFLSLFSHDPRDPSFNVVTSRAHVSNLCGLFGSHVSDALVQLIGTASFLVPVALVVFAFRIFFRPEPAVRRTELVSLFLLISGTCTLLARLGVDKPGNFLADHPGGGALGTFLHETLFKFFGSGGEIVLSLTFIVLGGLHIFRISMPGLTRFAASVAVVFARIVSSMRDWMKDVQLRYQESRAVHTRPVLASEKVSHSDDYATPKQEEVPELLEVPYEEIYAGDVRGGSWQRLSVLPLEHDTAAVPDLEYAFPEEFVDRHQVQPKGILSGPGEKLRDMRPKIFGKRVEAQDNDMNESEMKAAIEEYLREQSPRPVRTEDVPSDGEKKHPQEAARNITVTRRADESISRSKKSRNGSSSDDPFELPPSDLLDPPPKSSRTVDKKFLERHASILEQKLADLGVEGQVVAVHPGPVITMYELNLGPGIPLRKVLNMSDDLAMALKSGSTRVVAPISGKDTVGIEVPNPQREIVHLREIVESRAFVESDASLKIALGKGIDGEPFATSLTRMPHLLIAGATGTGKSVGLNCLICSWLLSCHPDDLKLLLVDPKKLELSHYQDIPHLLHPVVTAAEHVPAVLNWAIREMERRYDLLSKVGAKNIGSYNEKIRSGEAPSDPDGPVHEKLPYIVIIVDELAELMMVAAKDIEISIARLAQMARASGIHLILATQRPSVDVITGVIKANFPTRLSYQVSARADSRTILDTSGAENLLGMGDMLFVPPGTAKLRRLHGAYISEDEIQRVVDFVKAQRKPVYLKEISKQVTSLASKAPGSDMIEDEKYDQAVELVTRIGHASISLIQRHMRIGYNRAARIIETMEGEGLVGPSDGTSRPREVLVRSLEHIEDDYS